MSAGWCQNFYKIFGIFGECTENRNTPDKVAVKVCRKLSLAGINFDYSYLRVTRILYDVSLSGCTGMSTVNISNVLDIFDDTALAK